MKSTVANYKYRTFCLRIVAVNGFTVRITQHPRDLKMSNGQVYLSTVGYEFTGYQATANTTPSVVDLEAIAGFAGITKEAIASGVFDNARCYLFAVEWNNPVEDYESIALFFLGKTTLKDDRFSIEEMGLFDAINQNVGTTIAPTCQKRFGGQEFAGCKLTPTVVTATVTGVTNKFTITASSITNPVDFFGEGTVKFTSGNNAGLQSQEIKTHAAGGVLTVHEPFYYLPQVGDVIQVTEGCRKTKDACKAKGNILNFGGFSFIITTSQYVDRQTHE